MRYGSLPLQMIARQTEDLMGGGTEMPRCSISFWIKASVSGRAPSPAFSWLAEAHQTIVIIAASHLQVSKAANRISSLLGVVTLAEISVCPDEVRELERHEIKALSPACAQIFSKPPTGTGNWHFVKTPIKGATFNPTPSDVMAVLAPPPR